MLKKLPSFIFYTLLPFAPWAVATAAEKVAELYSAQGLVQKRQSPGTNWVSAPPQTPFYFLDAARTGEKSRAGILFAEGFLVRLNERSFIQFKSTDAGNPGLQLDSGAAHFFSRQPRRFPRVQT